MSTGVTTYHGRIHRGIVFKNSNDHWLAIGKTTAWADDSNPPAEDPTDTDITDIKGYKKITTKSMCYPVASGGDVTILGQDYKFCSDGDAYSNNARFVYLKGELDNTDFVESPTYEYRQVAIYTNLIPAAGHSGDLSLDPSDVTDNGVLEYYSNEQPIERRGDRNDEFEFVLEFY